jgi:putative two-component system response regulator
MSEPAWEAGVPAVAPDATTQPQPAPVLRPAPPIAQPVPLVADVLLVGNSTCTWHTVAEGLRGLGVSSRATTDPDSVFTLRAREFPLLMVIDDEAAGVDSLEFVRRVSKNPRLCDIPVVMLSSRAATEDKVVALSAGVVDYLCIPADPAELRARILAHLRVRRSQLDAELHTRHLEAFVLEQVKEITDSQMATIVALAKLAESRDDQTGGHLERVQQYCRLIAAKLSEQAAFGIIDHTFLDNIEYAAALHDIGKVAISDLILLKPGELTAQEFELMKTHTSLGAQTLEAVSDKYPSNDFIEMGIKIARWHHERWDGSGYPDALVGEETPLCARIMAVADVYDALTSQRAYKRAFSHDDSCRLIADKSGEHFDPDVVEAFLGLDEPFRRISSAQ